MNIEENPFENPFENRSDIVTPEKWQKMKQNNTEVLNLCSTIPDVLAAIEHGNLSPMDEFKGNQRLTERDRERLREKIIHALNMFASDWDVEKATATFGETLKSKLQAIFTHMYKTGDGLVELAFNPDLALDDDIKEYLSERAGKLKHSSES